jgi:glycosyltransferase involved in cell wall biosynthesis
MKKVPLVSIITPIYNNTSFLDRCVQSVLSQTYKNVEHIFIDGGSTDGTVEKLNKYQNEYTGRIRYVSEPDHGAGDAWNKGWKMANGEIIGWLGADDTYETDAIESVVDFFGRNHSIPFVFGECNIINETGQLICRFPTKDFHLSEAINKHNCIPTTSAFYTKELIEAIGPLDTSINACDYDYWIRVGKVFPIKRIDKLLSSTILHNNSVSGASEAGKIYSRENFIICRKHGGSLLSHHARKYYIFMLIGWARPVLYPILSPIGRKRFIYKVRNDLETLHNNLTVAKK